MKNPYIVYSIVFFPNYRREKSSFIFYTLSTERRKSLTMLNCCDVRAAKSICTQ